MKPDRLLGWIEFGDQGLINKWMPCSFYGHWPKDKKI